MKWMTSLRLAPVAMLAAAAQAQTLNDLFDESTVQEIRLTIHRDDWSRLQSNYLDNTYYPANFQWRGMALEEVGIRSRGSGSRSAAKPGLRIDFNRFAPGQQLLGLKSLVLDNLTQDPSMMRERLSMSLFRRAGLPAPRVVHARFYVNGSYAGLYTIVEPVDKGFLERALGNGGGYLYDYEWAYEYGFEYLGPDPENYSPVPFQLQTNESSPDPKPLIELIRIVNEAPDADLIPELSKYADPKHILTYLAVEAYLAEADGLAGDWGANNFYLYGPKQGAFHFIPWDKDVTFQGAGRSIWRNTERNVLTRRLLAVPELRDHFVQEVRRCAVLAGGAGGWLEQQVEIIASQIRPAVIGDPFRPVEYGDFEGSVTYLRYFALEREIALSYDLDALQE